MWYIFRKHTKQIGYWIINLSYGTLFLLLYFFTSISLGKLENLEASWRSLIFVLYWIEGGMAGIFLHFIFLFLCAILVLVYRFGNRNIGIKDVLLSREYIPEETLVVICVVGVLPELFIKIGCNAVYSVDFGNFSFTGAGF